MNFVKLKQANDWGAVYYALEPLTEHGYADRKRGINFYSDEEVTVRFPDGSIQTVNIDFKTEVDEVSDHGHYYSVTNNIPGFYVNNHGIKSFVAIDEVEVDESWAKSKTRLGRKDLETNS